jgi:hypothetical protein
MTTTRMPRWLRRFFDAVAFTIGLAGCTSPGGDRVRTVEVAVPTRAECVPANLGSAPIYPDTDIALRAAPDAAERFRLLAQGRGVRVVRLAELESVVEGCR